MFTVGVRLRQEGCDLLLGDHLIEPPQLLHQPGQILGGDMPGISLQRHKLQPHRHNQNETEEKNERRRRGGAEKPAGWDVTFALSDRSSTCVNCPCSEGSETTTPTNPDIPARAPRPAPAAAAEKNPDQKGPLRHGTRENNEETARPHRRGGAALGEGQRGEIPFGLAHGKAPSASARFPCARRKRRAMASRFRGGRGAEVGKWWNQDDEGLAGPVSLVCLYQFYSILFPGVHSSLFDDSGFPRGEAIGKR